MEWYNSLVKPSWTPPPATLNLIWTILCPIILVSFGSIYIRAFRGKVGWKITLPFTVKSAQPT
jgi:tryptophan-rich sensory protein